jgi:hypothetical protein
MPQRLRKVLVSEFTELMNEISPLRALALHYWEVKNFLGREVFSDIAMDADVREIDINDVLAIRQHIRNVIASASTESVNTEMSEIKHIPLLHQTRLKNDDGAILKKNDDTLVILDVLDKTDVASTTYGCCIFPASLGHHRQKF